MSQKAIILSFRKDSPYARKEKKPSHLGGHAF